MKIHVGMTVQSVTVTGLPVMNICIDPQLLVLAAVSCFYYRYPHSKRTGCENTAPLSTGWSACHCGNPWYAGHGQFRWECERITRFSRATCQVMLCSAIQNSLLTFNPLNAKLNPTFHLLALLGAHHIFHVSRIRVKNHSSYI